MEREDRRAARQARRSARRKRKPTPMPTNKPVYLKNPLTARRRTGPHRPAHSAQWPDHRGHRGFRLLAHRLLQQQEQGMADLHRHRRFTGRLGDGRQQDPRVHEQQHRAGLRGGEILRREHGGDHRHAGPALLRVSECRHSPSPDFQWHDGQPHRAARRLEEPRAMVEAHGHAHRREDGHQRR